MPKLKIESLSDNEIKDLIQQWGELTVAGKMLWAHSTYEPPSSDNVRMRHIPVYKSTVVQSINLTELISVSDHNISIVKSHYNDKMEFQDITAQDYQFDQSNKSLLEKLIAVIEDNLSK